MGRCGMAAAILVHFGHGLFLPSTPDRACQASGAVAGDEDDVRPFAPDHPALEAARAIAGSAPAAGGYGLGGMDLAPRAAGPPAARPSHRRGTRSEERRVGKEWVNTGRYRW